MGTVGRVSLGALGFYLGEMIFPSTTVGGDKPQTQGEEQHGHDAEHKAASGGARKGGNIKDNRAKGDAYRDQVSESLTAAGRSVTKEVTKQTPFGRRVIDIEVKHNGKTLGGVETKTGNSRYTSSQRAKDNYLKQQGYPVNVSRQPN